MTATRRPFRVHYRDPSGRWRVVTLATFHRAWQAARKRGGVVQPPLPR